MPNPWEVFEYDDIQDLDDENRTVGKMILLYSSQIRMNFTNESIQNNINLSSLNTNAICHHLAPDIAERLDRSFQFKPHFKKKAEATIAKVMEIHNKKMAKKSKSKSKKTKKNKKIKNPIFVGIHAR